MERHNNPDETLLVPTPCVNDGDHAGNPLDCMSNASLTPIGCTGIIGKKVRQCQTSKKSFLLEEVSRDFRISSFRENQRESMESLSLVDKFQTHLEHVYGLVPPVVVSRKVLDSTLVLELVVQKKMIRPCICRGCLEFSSSILFGIELLSLVSLV